MELRKLKVLALGFLATHIMEMNAAWRLTPGCQRGIVSAFKQAKMSHAKVSSIAPKEKEDKEMLLFEIFRKRYRYLPVLFPRPCYGSSLASNLDFSLGRRHYRMHYLIIQPVLPESWVIDRDLQKSCRNDLEDMSLPFEVRKLFLELIKDSPGYYTASKFDITSQIYDRRPVAYEDMLMVSNLDNPRSCTNTFIHQDAIKPLQEQFPMVIVHTPDRCIVGRRSF